MKKTENLRVRLPEDIEVRLWRTDQLLKNGRKDTAVSALAEMRDAVLKCRDIKPQLYCYYQYLELLNEPSEEKNAGTGTEASGFAAEDDRGGRRLSLCDRKRYL